MNIPRAYGFLAESSSRKTNTVLVNHRDQAWDQTLTPLLEEAPKTTVGSRFYATSPSDGPQALEFVDGTYLGGYPTSSTGLDATRHYRSALFVAPLKLWVLLDEMTPASTSLTTYTQTWNFPPELDADNRPHQGFKRSQFQLDMSSKAFTTFDDTDAARPNVEFRHFGATPNYVFNYGDDSAAPTSQSAGWQPLDIWSQSSDYPNTVGWHGTDFNKVAKAMNVQVNWTAPFGANDGSNQLLTLIIPRDAGDTSRLRACDGTQVPCATEYAGASPATKGFDATFPDGRLSVRIAPSDSPEVLTVAVGAGGYVTATATYLVLLQDTAQGRTVGMALNAVGTMTSGVPSIESALPGADFMFTLDDNLHVGGFSPIERAQPTAALPAAPPNAYYTDNMRTPDLPLANASRLERGVRYSYSYVARRASGTMPAFREFDGMSIAALAPRASGRQLSISSPTLSFCTDCSRLHRVRRLPRDPRRRCLSGASGANIPKAVLRVLYPRRQTRISHAGHRKPTRNPPAG